MRRVIDHAFACRHPLRKARAASQRAESFTCTLAIHRATRVEFVERIAILQPRHVARIVVDAQRWRARAFRSVRRWRVRYRTSRSARARSSASARRAPPVLRPRASHSTICGRRIRAGKFRRGRLRGARFVKAEDDQPRQFPALRPLRRPRIDFVHLAAKRRGIFREFEQSRRERRDCRRLPRSRSLPLPASPRRRTSERVPPQDCGSRTRRMPSALPIRTASRKSREISSETIPRSRDLHRAARARGFVERGDDPHVAHAARDRNRRRARRRARLPETARC